MKDLGDENENPWKGCELSCEGTAPMIFKGSLSLLCWEVQGGQVAELGATAVTQEQMAMAAPAWGAVLEVVRGPGILD